MTTSRRTSRWFGALTASLVIGLQSLPASAQSITPDQLLQRLSGQASTQGFTGKRTLKVYRQNSNPLVATANITFADRNNYDLKITSPASISGVQFNMQQGVNSAFFPDEKLFLVNGGQNTSYMPERIILSLFSPRTDLLKNNYEIKVLKDDLLNGVHAYLVEFVPRHRTVLSDEKTAVAQVPRRRYWLDKNSLQVLKENRYWDELQPDGSWKFSDSPYAESWYDIYSPGPKPAIPALQPTGAVNKVNLSGQEKNSFLTYKTTAEAATKGIRVTLPTYLPKGFVLKDIQIFTLFGAQIQVLNYTDGLNDLMITIRPQQNAFVTLMAGAFSLNLIKKITDLSHQAPNNYYSNASNNHIAVVFGDVMPVELERVASTLSLPAVASR
ncbi:MAG: hypothetical protein CVV27_04215 [Candidatus Melainabacteria bacterium HGW-Melainabacteria-1]|nr:MAG: hypothetical protein CVV27_04215 [Candidatus Melainabacteria bacterium HGW-Melainabacteria-1]